MAQAVVGALRVNLAAHTAKVDQGLGGALKFQMLFREATPTAEGAAGSLVRLLRSRARSWLVALRHVLIVVGHMARGFAPVLGVIPKVVAVRCANKAMTRVLLESDRDLTDGATSSSMFLF